MSFHKQLLRIMPEIMLPESREEPLHGHEEQRKTHLNNSISRKGRTGISSEKRDEITDSTFIMHVWMASTDLDYTAPLRRSS